MKKVWFIRHGESEANAGLSTSFPDLIALTDNGLQQAKALAMSLDEKPDLIITSKYIRTQQTARPTVNKFEDVPVEIWPLHEYDFLSPELCVNTTVEQRKPLVQSYWERCEATFVHGIGAESFYEFKSRMLDCIKRLESNPNKFIIVFAHGHVIRALWQYFLSDSTAIDNSTMSHFRDQMSQFPVPNASIFKASFEANKWTILP